MPLHVSIEYTLARHNHETFIVFYMGLYQSIRHNTHARLEAYETVLVSRPRFFDHFASHGYMHVTHCRVSHELTFREIRGYIRHCRWGLALVPRVRVTLMLMSADGLMVPTIHINGSSRERLVEDLCDAVTALHDAKTALNRTTPNGRDYYPQGKEALDRALRAHERRMSSLGVIIDELTAIVDEIGV
mgnify:CR=1 FL=1